MKKSTLFITLIIAYLCIGCTQQQETEMGKTLQHSHSISIETALSNLDNFLKSEKTRSNASSHVISIRPIKFGEIKTRTRSDVTDCENLVYIATFEGNNGYAVLAADDRISDPVLAVAESGTAPTGNGTITGGITNWDYYEGYPKNGPGFFLTPETGEEILLNPNTASYYDSVRNENMVGNFEIRNQPSSQNAPTRAASHKNLMGDISYMPLQMCIEYAESQVIANSASNGLTNFQDTLYDFETGKPIIINRDYDEIKYTYNNWEQLQYSDNLLNKYVDWHQGEPFNNLNPMRTQIYPWNRRKAPAGCFPLSIAKIQALFKFPSIFTNNDFTIDWEAINGPFMSIPFQASAPHLLRKISKDCQSLYFYGGTFTFPSLASQYLRNTGFQRVRTYDYNFIRVQEMIDEGKPIIIYSIPEYKGIDLNSSHCWNIDGYKVKKRTVKRDFYKFNKLVKTDYITEQKDMVHCDFGWGGTANGYYASGIFKLNDSNTEHDNEYRSSRNYDYTWYLKIMTYEKGVE